MKDTQMDTIFDRPSGLRFIGLTQMLFGFLAVVSSIGLLYAWYMGVAELVYSALVFFGVAIPCLVIGNYVDDLRRKAVIAQVIYSLFAVGMCTAVLILRGLNWNWTVPLFEFHVEVRIGYLAASIAFVEGLFALYLVARWRSVVPAPGVVIERDRHKARIIEMEAVPTPLRPRLLSADGVTEVSDGEERRILDIRKVTTEEGMAILCSNCGGATPISEIEHDNTVRCGYCGVRLAVGGVFVPCENHPEYLAATSCSVCGEHYCRRCLTAQEPPVDERWKGSTIFLCQKCFEGRYRPAVTTTSLVIPIDKLFQKASGRFSKVGGIYKRFLGMYAHVMRYVLEFTIRIAAAMAKSGGGGGRSSNDNAGSAILIIILIIIAIPIAVLVILLIGAIVIVPILFYAGLVGVTIEAIRIIRRTDFVTLDEAREKGIVLHESAKQPDTTGREEMRPWEKEMKASPSPKRDETYHRR